MLLALGLVSLNPSGALAAPQDLDTSFDLDGKATMGFPSPSDPNATYDLARAVVRQPSDGKIVVVGSTDQGTVDNENDDFAIARFNSDGTPDDTFGCTPPGTSACDGQVVTDFNSVEDVALAVAIDSTGRIVVVGYSDQGGATTIDYNLALARYTTTGQLDDTFDGPGTAGNGRFTVDLGSDDDTATSLALDGTRIVVAGYTNRGSGNNYNYNFMVGRFTATGAWDTTFATTGWTHTNFPTSTNSIGVDDRANAVAMEGTKVVVAGYSDQGPDCCLDNDFALSRYNANGTLDGTFDFDGKTTLDLGGPDDVIMGLVSQGGKITVAGYADMSPTASYDYDFAFARFASSDGSKDTTFVTPGQSTNGKFSIDLGSIDEGANALAIQPDGKLVAAGYSDASGSADNNDNFALVRLEPNGARDASFNGNGVTKLNFNGGNDMGNGLFVQPNGRIVVAGYANQPNGAGLDFALARYKGDLTCTHTGDANANTITGTSGDDVLCGRGGNDTLRGMGGADVLLGEAGDDTLDGGIGADSIDGGSQSDTVTYPTATAAVNVSLAGGTATGQGSDDIALVENATGGNFGDTLIGDVNGNVLNGGSGNDTLTGDTGDDSLVGGIGIDSLDAGIGNDSVNGGTEADALIGGDGTDTLVYSGAPTGVSVDLTSGNALGGDGLDTLSQFENITGSNHDDLLSGDAGSNTLNGGSGNDELLGRGAGDTLIGGSGTSDTATFSAAVVANLGSGQATGEGTDTLNTIENLTGSNLADNLIGDSGDNILVGRAGDDSFRGELGNDTITGSDGTDTVDFGLSGNGITASLVTGSATGEGTDTLATIENLTGSSHIDNLTGDASDNVLNGGAKNDLIQGRGGNDSLGGGSDIDTVSFADSPEGVVVNLRTNSATGDGTDSLEGFENITGSSSDDSFTGDTNGNRFEGGGGNDMLSFAPVATAMDVDLAAGTATGDGADTIFTIENVTGSNHADTLRGDSGPNGLLGGAGNDVLAGRGDDDNLDGGSEADTVDYSSSTAGVEVNLASGTATGEGTDTLAAVENASGSGLDDTFVSSIASNSFSGGAGNDTVSYAGSSAGVTVDLFAGTAAGDGSDTFGGIENLIGSPQPDTLSGDALRNSLSGGGGDDSLRGNGDDDMLDGGADSDTITFDAATAAVTVDLESGSASGEGTDTLAAIENATGTSGDDTFVQSSADNTLDGAAGADGVSYAGAGSAITANLADDTATGSGNDTLPGIENLTGSALDDTLIGDAAENTLDGGSGNDRLEGREEGDTLIGGADVDTVDYSASGTAVDVDLVSQTATDAWTDTLSGIENATGTSAGDTFTSSSSDNAFDGKGGSDTVDYGGAASGVSVNLASGTVSGHGSDTLVEIENVEGSEHADTFVSSIASNSLSGGAGNDTVSYAGSSTGVTVDLLAGTAAGDGSDTFGGIENLIGSEHGDSLTGDNGNNVLVGGEGDDTLEGAGGNDTITGAGGRDRASFANSTAPVTVYLHKGQATGNGTDMLSGIEDVRGSSFADMLTSDAGDNLLDGGPGNDVASFGSVASPVVVDLVTGTVVGQGSDTVANIERVAGSELDDVLTGNAGVNILTGNGGHDTLNGGPGNDTLNGNAGNDTASFEGGAAVEASLLSNKAIGQGNDTMVGIEDLTGTSNVDLLTGNDLANELDGAGGDDVLAGRLGNDRLIGGSGLDRADYSSAQAGIVAELALGTATGEGSDTFDSIEHLRGSAFPDTLRGDAGPNVLEGMNGNDTLTGNTGNDVLDGGDAVDTADYSASTGAAEVDLETGRSKGVDGFDFLTLVENVTGSSFNDKLSGTSGPNVLIGGSQNDHLIGREGSDLLDGGAGHDRFVPGGGDDVAVGAAGNDILDYTSSSSAVDVDLMAGTGSGEGADSVTGAEWIYGSAFNDDLKGDGSNNMLVGNAGNDALTGRGGNDTLDGGTGADAIDGGAGTDNVTYAGASAAVSVDLTTGEAAGNGTGYDTLAAVENAVGTDLNDTLRGNGSTNSLTGGKGNDNLLGEAGIDTLDGGEGHDRMAGGPANDTIVGGAGVDTVDFSASLAAVTVDLAAGTASGEGADSIVTTEWLQGSAFDDDVTGNGSNNTLLGGGGNDLLRGLSGNDRVEGGVGDDFLSGGFGSDTCVGGDGANTFEACEIQN